MKEERKKKCFFFFLRILNILTHTGRGENILKKLIVMYIQKGLKKMLLNRQVNMTSNKYFFQE